MNENLKTILKIIVFLLVACALAIPLGLIVLPVGGAAFFAGLALEALLGAILAVLSIVGALWYFFRQEEAIGHEKEYRLGQSREIESASKTAN